MMVLVVSCLRKIAQPGSRMEALANGHAAGDTVLKQLAGRLGTVFQDTDYLVRWGGEEFLVVARATPHTHAAAERYKAPSSNYLHSFQLRRCARGDFPREHYTQQLRCRRRSNSLADMVSPRSACAIDSLFPPFPLCAHATL